jgi:uncharacterized protein (TIGR00369 family)
MNAKSSPTGEYTDHLNIADLGCAEDGSYTLQVELEPIHLSRAGLAHGGLLFTLLDAAMGRAVIHSLPEGHSSPTIEMKINYFRPASKGKIVARGRLVNRSKQLCYGEGEITNAQGKLIARATATFFIKEVW